MSTPDLFEPRSTPQAEPVNYVQEISEYALPEDIDPKSVQVLVKTFRLNLYETKLYIAHWDEPFKKKTRDQMEQSNRSAVVKATPYGCTLVGVKTIFREAHLAAHGPFVECETRLYFIPKP